MNYSTRIILVSALQRKIIFETVFTYYSGVGYSYSDDKNYSTDDKETAKANYAAVKEFIRKFPKFAKNDLYIAG